MATRPVSEPLYARLQLPTWGMLFLCYGAFAMSATTLSALWLPLGIAVAALAIALHSSLSHEVLHGHPFKNRHLNAALVYPALSFCVPYMRFRDTHLAHHEDSIITDPYDDPETNYLDPRLWVLLARWQQRLLRFNNTLAGRLLLGPVLGQVAFMLADWRLIRQGNRRVLISWLWHLPAAALPVWWIVQFAAMPLWAYFIAVYAGHSILKIRTFLEHRAHEKARGRTVVIEDRGLLSFLFLNNNFHSVHHAHPAVPWYDLPARYRAGRARYDEMNDGYYYRSYAEIFRAYFFRAKDPVPHPLWPSE